MVLTSGEVSVSSAELLESAQTRPFTTEFLQKQLGRLGETGWQLGALDNQLEGAVMMAVSAVNRLRRALVDALDGQKSAPAPRISSTGKLEDLLPAVKKDECHQRELSALCRSMEQIEAALEEKGLKSRIHRKGRRGKPLSEREKRGNKTRSSVRVRVEHIFGAQSNDMGGTLVRSIGLVRATTRIGLKNLAYNMRRLVQLERLAATTA